MNPRPLIVLDVATADIDQAMRWYDAKASGLGRVFLAELNQQARRIRQFPEGYPLLYLNYRRASLHRFPYGILYRVLPALIEIAAVFPDRIDPRRLIHRMTEPTV